MVSLGRYRVKRDINFLEVKKQGENKKGANTTAILAVIMLIVIGVMGFVFGNTMNKIKTLDTNIAALEHETTSGKYAKREAEYNKIQRKLESFMLDTLKKQALDDSVASINTMSRDLFEQIYTSATDEDGIEKINIKSYTFNSNLGIIRLSCNVIGEGSKEKMKEVELFVNRLNSKTYLKDAVSTGLDLDSNGVLIFNVDIVMEQNIVEEEEI